MTSRGRRVNVIAARLTQRLLAAGLLLWILGESLGIKAVSRVSAVLAAAGLASGIVWLTATLYTMRRSGSQCLLETYLSIGLWALTPWGIYTQIRQLVGEARHRRNAISNIEAYRPRITLAPPFCGCWVIARGGVTPEESHSWDMVSQRYAYDLVACEDREKLTNPCRYRRLDDWHTYGAPIVAAAPGRVIAAIDGIPDNTPVGRIRLGSRHPAGNHVVVEHRPGLYTLYAHLRKGSVSVEPGDEVEALQQIGEAGNSGLSTLPHLHFQLMTTSNPLDTLSLPAHMRYKTPQNRIVEDYPSGRGSVIYGLCQETRAPGRERA